ncbi:MAG: hypothetical protein ACI865_001931 [Flavobacteriaceae bacterium]|jgi:uncharacterized protein YkuJ
MKSTYSYLSILLFFSLLSQASVAQELVPFRTLTGKYYYVEQGGTDDAALIGEWDRAYLFFDGVARVELNGKYGFINRTGEVVAEIKYSFANDFIDGLAKVSVKDASGREKFGLIDNTGYAVLPTIYDQLGEMSEGRIAVVKKEKLGFADRDGGLPVALQFDYEDTEFLPKFNEGMCAIGKTQAGKPTTFGIIDENGYFMIPQTYEAWGGAAMYNYPTFSAGLAVFKKNGKYGYMDEAGGEVIPAQFDGAEMFSEGLAPVRLKNKIFYIDVKGNQAMERTLGGFDEGVMGFTYNGFENGLAFVNINTDSKIDDSGSYSFKEILAIIDKKGNIVARGVEVYSKENEHFRLEATSEQEANLIVNRTGEVIVKSSPMSISEKDNFVRIGSDTRGETADHYFVDAKGTVYMEK